MKDAQHRIDDAGRWVSGNFGEGYALYVKIGDHWHSVNGQYPFVMETRYLVSNGAVIEKLEVEAQKI